MFKSHTPSIWMLCHSQRPKWLSAAIRFIPFNFSKSRKIAWTALTKLSLIGVLNVIGREPLFCLWRKWPRVDINLWSNHMYHQGQHLEWNTWISTEGVREEVMQRPKTSTGTLAVTATQSWVYLQNNVVNSHTDLWLESQQCKQSKNSS